MPRSLFVAKWIAYFLDQRSILLGKFENIYTRNNQTKG